VEEGHVNNVGYGQGRGHAACERHGQKDAVLQAAALRCTVARSVWGVAQRAGARASRDHRGDGDVWEDGRASSAADSDLCTSSAVAPDRSAHVRLPCSDGAQRAG
jgi:hypothetical protein